MAALFGLALVSGFLEAKEGEEVQDLFEPRVRPREFLKSEGEVKQERAQLEGMGLGGGKAFAVINGKVYQEGEEKEGIRVIHIRKKEVDILINGIPETLQRTPYEADKR